jgi:thiamine monophosphate kinase
MSSDATGELTSALREHAGERLRGIAVYNGDEYELLFLRKDVQQTRIKAEVDDMVVYLQRHSHAKEEAAFPFGTHRASTQFFDDAVVIHVPRGNQEGIVVTLDHGSDGPLAGLVHACLEWA